MQWHMPIGYKVVDGKITICEEQRKIVEQGETYAMQKGKCPGPMHPLAGYWKIQATLAQNTIRSS